MPEEAEEKVKKMRDIPDSRPSASVLCVHVTRGLRSVR
jgi:hypothetical protein